MQLTVPGTSAELPAYNPWLLPTQLLPVSTYRSIETCTPGGRIVFVTLPCIPCHSLEQLASRGTVQRGYGKRVLVSSPEPPAITAHRTLLLSFHCSASFKNKENIDLSHVAKYSHHENVVGSPEVQIARLTARVQQISWPQGKPQGPQQQARSGGSAKRAQESDALSIQDKQVSNKRCSPPPSYCCTCYIEPASSSRVNATLVPRTRLQLVKPLSCMQLYCSTLAIGKPVLSYLLFLVGSLCAENIASCKWLAG